MQKVKSLLALLTAVLCMACFGASQTLEENPYGKSRISTGIGFEYFSRMVESDNAEEDSKLNTLIFTINGEFEIMKGFSISLLAGYSLTNFDSMVFRELPISIALEEKQIGGYLLGGEISKSLFTVSNFEISASGLFVYYIGMEKQFDVSGLNVDGSVTCKPTWMRLVAGPKITYRGFYYFSPYLSVNYDRLVGTYKMSQDIQDLTGEEEKELTAKSLLNITAGILYEASASFKIKGEAYISPYSGGSDLGLQLRLSYSF